MEAKEAEQHDINRLALGPGLTEQQAQAIFALFQEAVVFALLKQSKMIAEQNADKLPVGSFDDP